MSVTVADLVRCKSRYISRLSEDAWKHHPAQSWIASIPELIAGAYIHDQENPFDTLVFTDQALWKWNQEAVRVAYSSMRVLHLPRKEAVFDYGLCVELEDGRTELFGVKGEAIPQGRTTRQKDLYVIGGLLRNIIHHTSKAT